MSYYFSKTLHTSLDRATAKAIESLQQSGFGILTEIDVQATMKKKLNVDMQSYKILGACNPAFAYQALQIEDKNEYWPHLFLADGQGIIRYDHIGEGAYNETEAKIRQLLGRAA